MMPCNIYTVYNPNHFAHSKGRYTDEHVYRFERMVAQHVTAPHKIHVIRSKLDGWWGKIDLFQHKHVFYMDLSVAIIKNIDHLVKFDTPFAALRDFVRPEQLNSKVMGWNGDVSHVYDKFYESPTAIMAEYTVTGKWGDQDFIDKHIGKRDYYQDFYPNQIESYKLGKLTDETHILAFHGKPKPEDTEYW